MLLVNGATHIETELISRLPRSGAQLSLFDQKLTEFGTNRRKEENAHPQAFTGCLLRALSKSYV